jgi:hypothetical protein
MWEEREAAMAMPSTSTANDVVLIAEKRSYAA